LTPLVFPLLNVFPLLLHYCLVCFLMILRFVGSQLWAPLYRFFGQKAHYRNGWHLFSFFPLADSFLLASCFWPNATACMGDYCVFRNGQLSREIALHVPLLVFLCLFHLSYGKQSLFFVERGRFRLPRKRSTTISSLSSFFISTCRFSFVPSRPIAWWCCVVSTVNVSPPPIREPTMKFFPFA